MARYCGVEIQSDEIFIEWLDKNADLVAEALLQAPPEDHTLVEIVQSAEAGDLYSWLAIAFFRCLERAFDPENSLGTKKAIALRLQPRSIAQEAWRWLAITCNYENVGYGSMADILEIVAHNLPHTTVNPNK